MALADFDLYFDGSVTDEKRVGTPGYLAPEMGSKPRRLPPQTADMFGGFALPSFMNGQGCQQHELAA